MTALGERVHPAVIVPTNVEPVVRHAAESDLPRLVELLKDFGASRQFREAFTRDPEILEGLLRSCLRQGAVFVLVDTDRIIGCIVVCLIGHPLSHERIAAELAWFVDPAYRGGGYALLRAAEQWARGCGVTRLSLVAPTVRIGRIYERWGYCPMEATYSKTFARRSLASVPRRGVEGVTIAPAQFDDWPLVWTWLNEDHDANFDDAGPHALHEFIVDRQHRQEAGCRTWVVSDHEAPCGFISWTTVTPRLGMLQGLCFTRRVQGKGIAATAVHHMLSEAFAEGVEKMSATYFATNQHVRNFLHGLGAVDEGLLSRHTTQDGQAVDMRVVAIFAPERKDF